MTRRRSQLLACAAGAQRTPWAAGRAVGPVVRVEPGFEAGAQTGALTVHDGEPGGVPVSAADDGCLSKGALIGEAEPFGGRSGGRVENVTLPLVAAVAKVVENMPHQQVLRLGGRGPALQQRGEV